MTNEMIFKLEKEFQIGELKLKAYQWKYVTLFDPTYLIEMVGEEFKDNNSKSTKQRVLKRLHVGSVVNVNVEEVKDKVYNYKNLLTPQGVYEILFFIESHTARRIRVSFVNLLESFRKEKGIPVDIFLKDAYEQRLVPVHNSFDRKHSIEGDLQYAFLTIPTEDLFVMNAYNFPVVRDIVIFDEHSEFFRENIREALLGTKLDFYISCKKVLSAIGEITATDKVTVIDKLIKDDLKAYKIDKDEFSLELEEDNTNLYYNGLELMKYIFNKCNEDFKRAEGLFKRIMDHAFNNKLVSTVLFESVTKYSHVNHHINYMNFEKFITSLGNHSVYYEDIKKEYNK